MGCCAMRCRIFAARRLKFAVLASNAPVKGSFVQKTRVAKEFLVRKKWAAETRPIRTTVLGLHQ